VRYQLAFSLGAFNDAAGTEALTEIIRRDASDRWVRAAVLNSLKTGADKAFDPLVADAPFRNSPSGQEFLRLLTGVIGTKNDSGEVQAVLIYLQKNADSDIAFLLTRALGDGLQSAGTSIYRADSEGKLKPIFARAKATANSASVPAPTRTQAVQLLALSNFEEAGETLSVLLSSSQSESVQQAAVLALARFDDARVSETLLKRWPELAARIRGEAMTVMLTRTDRILSLFKAVEERTVPASEFTAQQVQMLRAHRDLNIREQAIRLFGAPPAVKRDEVVKAFLPALQLRGDPVNGKKIYQERCAACHRIGSLGQAVGPDLVTVKAAGKETLLVNILDPNREVAPRYLNYTVETKSDESFSGVIVSESASGITLRGTNGTETLVLRSQIDRMRASGQSLMPEGLEIGLTPQDMADLIEYLGVAD
jgi:putative heme-binding domain-containing protein